MTEHDRTVSKLGLGTVQWGLQYGVANRTGKPSVDTIREMLRVASRGGIGVLDTASAYGNAEELIGLSETSRTFRVVTKAAAEPLTSVTDEDARRLESTVRQSLARLKRESVDALLIHASRNLLEAGGERLWNACERLQAAGLVHRIGVSVYRPADLDALVPRFRLQVVQLPFNVFDQRFARTGWLRRLKERQVEVHARSAFLQGALLLTPEELPSPLHELAGHLARWRHAAASHGLSPHAAALAFCLSHPDVDVVVVGCERIQQLEDAIAITRSPLTDFDQSSFSIDDDRLIEPTRWTSS